MRMRFLVSALSALLAVGCATFNDFTEGRAGLVPVGTEPGTYWDKNSVEPNEAILIIGYLGQYHGGSFEGSLGLFSITLNAAPSMASAGASERVYAFPFKVGETFRLTKVKYFGGGDLGQAKVSPQRVQYWMAEVPNAPPIKFEKPGVYYYGTIATKDKKVYYTDQFPAELKRITRQQFPYVYAKLPEAR